MGPVILKVWAFRSVTQCDWQKTSGVSNRKSSAAPLREPHLSNPSFCPTSQRKRWVWGIDSSKICEGNELLSAPLPLHLSKITRGPAWGWTCIYVTRLTTLHCKLRNIECRISFQQRIRENSEGGGCTNVCSIRALPVEGTRRIMTEATEYLVSGPKFWDLNIPDTRQGW
jgi:hypothetical protein